MPSKKTKTTVRVDRLRKLADFLDKLPRSHFNFGTVRDAVGESPENQCGTVGCAIGWCPDALPGTCRVVRSEFGGELGRMDVVAKGHRQVGVWSDRMQHAVTGAALFGISEDHAYMLFTPDEPSPANQRSELGRHASPKAVAKRIRTYAAWCERTGVRA